MLRLIEMASRNSPRSFSGLSEPEALTRLGVLVPHGGSLVPSLAGLLSVGTYPHSRGQDLSEVQTSVLALANAGYEVDIALLRRMGLGSSDARRQLSQLRDLSLLQPRRARDDGSYRLAPGRSDIAAKDEAPSRPGSSLAERILEALGETDSASREELQDATGASRSSVINALDDLIAGGTVEATAPARSPIRRYRRTQA